VTLFISYSSRDKDAVKNLTQELQDADEQVWMDQRLAGGDAWWRAILEQIRGCDVFIFALSQNSIQSKPCQAELHYAQALGLPILPVQVGSVDSMQLNPLATVQTIDYRTRTPSTAMRLISALNRTRAQRQPLPSPLPDEPEVPFEYLIRLYTTVAGPDQLSPRDQAALVAQLQVGLREDGDHDAARNDIVTLLTKLRDREDVTYRTRNDVEAILASIDSQSTTPSSSVAKPALPTSAPEPAHLDDSRSATPSSSVAKPALLTSAPEAAHLDDPQIATPPRQPWWRRGAIVIPAALVTVAVIAAAIVMTSQQHENSNGSPITLPTGTQHREPAYRPQVTLPLTGLNRPSGVAVDSAGNLYVIDASRVLKLSAGTSNQEVLPFTGLDKPLGVAVDSAGDLYVTNVAMAWKLAAGSSSSTVLPFTNVGFLFGVAVDTAGNLYVTDNGNNQLLKLAVGSAAPTVLASTGLGNPAGVAVDTAGNVYITDNGNNRVLRLAAGSGTPSVLPFTGLNQPQSVAVDTAGDLYVSDNRTNRVLELMPGSGTPSVLPFTGLNWPTGVAVDSAGNLYVADQQNNRVLKLPAV
jgi:DNA-binding beta-propeller fold protein YncE